MEICAAIFTLILVFPLVLQLHMLILNPKKLCSIFHYYATTPEDTPNRASSPQLLQHYPKESILSDMKSDSKISLTNLRTISSSPAIAPQLSNTETHKKSSKSILLTVKHSCTFVKTDQVLPVVDISWNYNSYRYIIFEKCLRNLYGENYPPGEVVLNSMQLNLFDSRTNVSGAETANLFDFVKDSELTLTDAVSKKLEIEYLNPLDHFVAKPADKPFTEERSTGTLQQDQRRSSDNAGSQEEPIRGVITGGGKNRRSCRKIEPCKCNLSLVRRVYGADDVRSGRKHSLHNLDHRFGTSGLVASGSIGGPG